MGQYRKCPVCGCKSSNLLIEFNMFLPKEYHLPDSYDIVSCKNCGMSYADTKATDEDYNLYYQNINYYSQKPPTENYSIILEKWMDIIRNCAGKEDTILDMGFGDGQLLLELSKNGYNNIIGIDTTEEGVSHLKSKGINALYGSIYDKVPDDIKKICKVFILSGVLEHLLQPEIAINSAKEYLSEDGILIILVPNMDRLEQLSLPISYYFHQEHINYFTPTSLLNIMNLNGFELLSIYPEFDNYGNMVVVFKLSKSTDEQIKNISNTDSLYKFFEKEKEKDRRRISNINKIIENEESVIIWGAGAYLMRLWSISNISKANIIAIIDKNSTKAENLEVGGYKVYLPEAIKENGWDSTILVFCAKNPQSILNDIDAMGIKNKIIVI